jgi:hypothetical protein
VFCGCRSGYGVQSMELGTRYYDGNESASHIFHKSASRMLVFLFSTGQAWIAPLVIVLGRSRGHHQWDTRLERSVTRFDGFWTNWMGGT